MQHEHGVAGFHSLGLVVKATFLTTEDFTLKAIFLDPEQFKVTSTGTS